MASTHVQRCSLRDRLQQHHSLNWIVISRYRMAHHGISKNAMLKHLGNLENILKKIKYNCLGSR